MTNIQQKLDNVVSTGLVAVLWTSPSQPQRNPVLRYVGICANIEVVGLEYDALQLTMVSWREQYNIDDNYGVFPCTVIDNNTSDDAGTQYWHVAQTRGLAKDYKMQYLANRWSLLLYLQENIQHYLEVARNEQTNS